MTQHKIVKNGLHDRRCACDRIPVHLQFRLCRRQLRNKTGGNVTDNSNKHQYIARDEYSVIQRNQLITENRAEEDRQICPGADQSIPAHKFFRHVAGDIRILDGAVKSRLSPHEKKKHKQDRDTNHGRFVKTESPESQNHQHDLNELYLAEQLVLGIFIRHLPCCRRKRKLWKHHGSHGNKGKSGCGFFVKSGLISDQDDQSIPEQIVIQSAPEKSIEKRKKTF